LEKSSADREDGRQAEGVTATNTIDGLHKLLTEMGFEDVIRVAEDEERWREIMATTSTHPPSAICAVLVRANLPAKRQLDNAHA